MVQTASPPADTADPISNAVLTQEASLFTREILKSALANPAAASASWRATAHALLANVLMNDVLNLWNDAGQPEIQAAQDEVNLAGTSALAQHAQGLIHRAQGDQSGALSAFRQAVNSDPGFARAQAQVGNQLVLNASDRNQARTQIQTVINQNPNHPALGYFYWALGRAYFVDQDWRNAIIWLSKSVDTLPNVSYNRHYLAVAKQNAGDTQGAKTTLQQFINDPQFGDPQLGKQKVRQLVPPAAPNPSNDPVIAARQNLRAGLLAVLANLP
jgi:soluble lytic murein transglycosylase